MRSLWFLVLFVLVVAAMVIVSCNENDTEDDGTAVTYEQKQPSNPATPADSDVKQEESAGSNGSETATETGQEGTEGTTGESSTTADEAGESQSTDEGKEAVSNEGNGSEEGMTEKGEGNTVVLETTKGNIVILLHDDWSPLGVAHFKELVNAKFYDGAPWFRVIDGFVAQCGISADPKLNAEWEEKTIKDEPVVKGNMRGTVVYGKTGMPNSRSTHFYINYADNSASLDRQGFSAFGEVIEGMDIADSLTRCEYGDQGGLAAPGGLDKFKARFPDADYIKLAYVK